MSPSLFSLEPNCGARVVARSLDRAPAGTAGLPTDGPGRPAVGPVARSGDRATTSCAARVLFDALWNLQFHGSRGRRRGVPWTGAIIPRTDDDLDIQADGRSVAGQNLPSGPRGL